MTAVPPTKTDRLSIPVLRLQIESALIAMTRALETLAKHPDLPAAERHSTGEHLLRVADARVNLEGLLPAARRPGDWVRSALIVDDDNINRVVLRGGITVHNKINVTEATDGLRAVCYAIRDTPDLILMDIYMPNLSGLDAIRAIRSASNASGYKPVIIVKTADTTPGLRTEALARGADRVIQGRYNPSVLIAAIAECAPAAKM